MTQFNYLRGDKLLLPYAPGLIDFKDTVLVDIYNKMKEDDLYEIVFHDNHKMTLNQFISFFSSGVAPMAFFCIIKDGIEIPAGLCWVTDIVTHGGGIKKANGSFCFFKEFQTPAYTNELGKMAIDYWLNVLEIDIVYGMTPSNNRPALIYIKRLGFIEVGRIPNYCYLTGNTCAGVITYIDRDIFRERCGNG